MSGICFIVFEVWWASKWEKTASEGIDRSTTSQSGRTSAAHRAAISNPGMMGNIQTSQTSKPLSFIDPYKPMLKPSWNGHCAFSLNKYIWKRSVTVYGNVCTRRMFEPIPWKQAMFGADSLSPLIAGNGFQMCVARWSLSVRTPSSCLIKPLQGEPDGGMIPRLWDGGLGSCLNTPLGPSEITTATLAVAESSVATFFKFENNYSSVRRNENRCWSYWLRLILYTWHGLCFWPALSCWWCIFDESFLWAS